MTKSQIFKSSFTSLMILVFLIGNAFSQSHTKYITVITDSSGLHFNVDNVVVLIIQKGKVNSFKLGQKIPVESGLELGIELSIVDYQFPGIKKLKIYSDTTISINSISLLPVVVKGKKSLVKQTLDGYEYFPERDTVFKNQSILFSLQRLPFITVTDEEINYRNEKKIWYRINGKDRKAIEENWGLILNSIPTANIFKVELITDLPLYIKNKGYNVILNILTNEDNIRGTAVNAAVIADQRENFNKNIGVTVINKRNDFSFKINDNEDNYLTTKDNEVKKQGVLISKNEIENLFSKYNLNSSIKFGRRIDSMKDFAASVGFSKSKMDNDWRSIENFPAPINNFTNSIIRYGVNINSSYLFRKSKLVESSFAFMFGSVNEKFDNRISNLFSNSIDSINKKTESNQLQIVVEFNHINRTNKKFLYEYGVQSYSKELIQDFSIYEFDNITQKESNLLFRKRDSLKLNQLSLRPYFKFNSVYEPKHLLSIGGDLDMLIVNTQIYKTQNFILPSLFIQNKVLKNNTSITILGEFAFLKPSDNYYKPIQIYLDPLTNLLGNIKLIPEKSLDISLEIIKENKNTIRNQFGFSYNFDVLNYYTKFDTTSNILKAFSNNNSRNYRAYWNLGYDFSLKSKLFISVEPELAWELLFNKFSDEKFSGFVVGGSWTVNYNIGKSYGDFGFLGIIRSNAITSQGYRGGINKYTLYYRKIFLKNKFIISVSASNFLLKNREQETYIKDGEIENRSYNSAPYRLLNCRIAYSFSNFKKAKFSKLKSTSIQNEAGEKTSL